MTLEWDQDVHLVVGDPRYPSRTMIVKFPATNCTRGAAPERRAQMSAARAALIRACGAPSARLYTFLRGTATITGVGYFDEPGGQTGYAPNWIELHPVLAFAHARCRPTR